jgi:hypothetical protein
MGVSDEAKNLIALKFLRKIKKIFFHLVNSIRVIVIGIAIYIFNLYKVIYK